jgi:GNAT superfamily N-acetyltransferase
MRSGRQKPKVTDPKWSSSYHPPPAMTAESGTRTIARAELSAAPSQALLAALNAELSAMYPEPGANHFGLNPPRCPVRAVYFSLPYSTARRSVAARCALIHAETGEFKRMYVAPSGRGNGFSKRLVAGSRRRRGRWAPSGSGSKPASDNWRRWHSIAARGFNRFRCTANTWSPP